MKATIIENKIGLQGQSRRGTYTYLELTYQPDPYKGQTKKPSTKKIFENMDIYHDVAELEAGDYVELFMEKINGYWNITGFTKLDRAESPQANQQQASGGGSKQSQQRGADINRSIERQVSLKAAVDLLVAVAEKGTVISAAIVKEYAEEIDTFFTKKPVASKDVPQGKSNPDNPEDDDELPF